MKTLIKVLLTIAVAYLIGIMIYFTVIDTNRDKTYSKQEIEAIQIEYYTYGFKDGQECGYVTRTGIVRLNDTLPISPEKMQLILDAEIATTYPRYSFPQIGGSK